MSDKQLRELQRKAASGDIDAQHKLSFVEARHGINTNFEVYHATFYSDRLVDVQPTFENALFLLNSLLTATIDYPDMVCSSLIYLSKNLGKDSSFYRNLITPTTNFVNFHDEKIIYRHELQQMTAEAGMVYDWFYIRKTD